MSNDSNPRTLGDELNSMLFDGRRRAQVRARLMQRLDQQLAALTRATASDIERLEQDAHKLIEFTDVLLAHPAALHSIRDPGQFYKVKKKLAALKAELAKRAENRRSQILPPMTDLTMKP